MQNRDTTKYITYFFNYFTIQYLVLPKNSCSFAFEIMNRKMKVKTILTLALAATTLAACHRGKKTTTYGQFETRHQPLETG